MSTEALLARVASRYENGNGEAASLTASTLERLEYRRRHSGKECAKCGESRPLSDFTTDSRKPDGLDRRCKSCKATQARERRSRSV